MNCPNCNESLKLLADEEEMQPDYFVSLYRCYDCNLDVTHYSGDASESRI